MCLSLKGCSVSLLKWGFSGSVASGSLWPHGLQHSRHPCPSLCPRACSNLCPLKWWCHPTVSSSVVPFSSCPQSVPGSVSFPVSWLFASGASASVSVLQMNIQGWSPLGWTGLISLQSRDSQESSPAPQFESITSLALSLVCCSTLTSIHDYWKNHSLD